MTLAQTLLAHIVAATLLFSFLLFWAAVLFGIFGINPDNFLALILLPGLAEQGNWVTRWIRPAFALPFVIYNFKIVVWDKVLGFGTTDPLPPEFWQLQMIVFGAYFLTRPLEKRR